MASLDRQRILRLADRALDMTPVAIITIDNSEAVTADIRGGLKKWFADYSEWMTTHKYGRDEMNARNNHSVAYMVQLAACRHSDISRQYGVLCAADPTDTLRGIFAGEPV